MASGTGYGLRLSPTRECAYHTTGKSCRCRHIAAVEHKLLISSEAALGKKISVKEQDLRCPKRKKKKYVRVRWYRGEHEDGQRYKCSTCGRRFGDNLGFEYRHMPRLFITLALMLSGMGILVANIQMTLAHLGVRVYVDTITRILDYYSKTVEEYVKTIKPPNIQDPWGCDEKESKVCGKKRWIVAVIDLTSRFILAWDISDTKKNYDATPLLRAAKDRAGKIPRPYIADGLDQCHIAFKKGLYTLKGIRSIHIRDIHIRNLIRNTNKQERLNGEFASRFKPARGINKEESLIFRIAVLHHNYIKPHGGIGGRTPAEVAGIDIQGSDRWLTLIQTAVSAV